VISLRVNGKPVELPGPTPLLDYVGRLGVDPRAIAVEVNGEILQRDGYAGCTLADGDAVEIVRMVGGGAPEHRAVQTVGVRALKADLSRYLAAVRDGGEVVVTDHGRPIARVVPIHEKGSAGRLAELIAAGEAEPAARLTRTVPRPARLPGDAAISDLVPGQRR
jgi:thiamine biosynthesis protein ThiS